MAPPDVNLVMGQGWRYGNRAGYGGAFEYDGGSSDPSSLAKITFVEVVFDHNAACAFADFVNNLANNAHLKYVFAEAVVAGPS